MAVEGHGIAFLPLSAVKKELRAKKLVSAAGSIELKLEMTMDIRVYRERSSRKGAAKNSVEALWSYLQAQSQSQISK